MLVPLVKTLQAGFPHAKITWVISRPAFDLVEGLEGVEFIVINKPNHLRDYFNFKKLLGKRKFDVLIGAQASFRANLLYPFIRAKRKLGFDSLRAKDGHGLFIKERISPGNDHTLESFLKFADLLGISEKKIAWNLPITDSDWQWATNQLPQKKPCIVINPAASKPERSWRIAQYINAIIYIKEKWGAEIVLTGGPGPFDYTCGQQISEKIAVTNLIGKTKPKQLLAVISQCDFVLCPDTGPSHMAAAVSTPVIALHAVTSAKVSGPYIYQDLAVDYYPEAVKVVLKKEEQTNIWGDHAHGENTMELIPLEVVLRRIDQVFVSLGYSPIN